jgi:hypothetical protein
MLWRVRESQNMTHTTFQVYGSLTPSVLGVFQIFQFLISFQSCGKRMYLLGDTPGKSNSIHPTKPAWLVTRPIGYQHLGALHPC